MRFLAALLALSTALAGCASPRPRFYPDARYKEVGDARAQQDADACLAEAKAYVKANPLAPVARKTGWGAMSGAAIGVVIGAITGDIKGAVESGAAAGGVGGAAQGAYDSTKPDDLVRAYTDRCLAEKGYTILGWR